MENKTLNLSSLAKEKVTITGVDDKERILEINIGDIGIVTRLSNLYPKLNALDEKATKIATEETENTEDFIIDFGKKLKEIDDEMRSIIDELFDANVSEVCAPTGTMYDMINGEFRYEIIIDAVLSLYNDAIKESAEKRRKLIQKHTDKFTPKDHLSKIK